MESSTAAKPEAHLIGASGESEGKTDQTHLQAPDAEPDVPKEKEPTFFRTITLGVIASFLVAICFFWIGLASNKASYESNAERAGDRFLAHLLNDQTDKIDFWTGHSLTSRQHLIKHNTDQMLTYAPVIASENCRTQTEKFMTNTYRLKTTDGSALFHKQLLLHDGERWLVLTSGFGDTSNPKLAKLSQGQMRDAEITHLRYRDSRTIDSLAVAGLFGAILILSRMFVPALFLVLLLVGFTFHQKHTFAEQLAPLEAEVLQERREEIWNQLLEEQAEEPQQEDSVNSKGSTLLEQPDQGREDRHAAGRLDPRADISSPSRDPACATSTC